MNLLVIGIDGGTKEIIEKMPMPFTQSLMRHSESKVLNEDLISRGWAEVLTGEHASENRAFYLMPCADGSYDFSAAYTKDDMVGASGSKAIWKLLNERGVSVGIVNVPTTGPADQVDGFIVAGGGGGQAANAGMPKGMVFPPDYESILKENGYIFDVRLPGGERTVSGFMERIKEAELSQKNTFVDLCKKSAPQFAFHCFRITTEVQYLARKEIDECAEKLRNYEGGVGGGVSDLQKNIVEHYKFIDDSIKDMFESFSPDNYMLIGDHSTALFEYEANVDVWLSKQGYLSRLSGLQLFWFKVKRFVLKYGKKVVGNTVKPKSSLIRRPITIFSQKKTVAFGTFYDTGNFAGIYVNDNARFGGPVNGSAEEEALVDEICERFNNDHECTRLGLKAQPYRRLFSRKPYQYLMPDIQIHKSDSIYFSSRKWTFFDRNSNLKPLDESLIGVRYPHTGVKGRDPVFVYSSGLGRLIKDDDPNDLRLAYRLIDRAFR